MQSDIFVAPFEVKAVGSPDAGGFEGYGAVFGNVDSHGDVVMPGAFAAGLADLAASGRKVAMHLHHGLPQMGGRRGVGTWSALAEDTRGLHVKGRIAGMATETGRHLHACLAEGALTGLSIGYVVRPDGAEHGTKAAALARGARRALKAVDLHEISIVDTPSNADSLIVQVKALMRVADGDAAAAALAAAIRLHLTHMAGGDAMTAQERAAMLAHLQDAHAHLTGSRSPAGLKKVARAALAGRGGHADEPGIKAAEMAALADTLAGFKLPTL